MFFPLKPFSLEIYFSFVIFYSILFISDFQEPVHKLEDSSMGANLLGALYKLWQHNLFCDVRLQLPNGTMLNVRIDRIL